jgi:ATP-dependent Clp protease ATP-binding subunit ClpX
MEGVNLKFTRDAITAIAAKALELKTGARALRAIMENIMLELMFSLPDQSGIEEIVISGAVIEGKKKPLLRMRPDRVVDAPAPPPEEDSAPDSASHAA